jgi:EAL domain-containing protein (putative c-di-GMP-specific phosphodiesterase class I)
VLRSLELRTDLEEAIRTRQFELHYQPILDLATGGLAGMEALVRWRHPTRGVLQPEDFIPLAEATGAIVPLGRWILDEACREAVTWSAITPTAAAALGVAPTAEVPPPPPPSAQAVSPVERPQSPYGRPAEQPAWAPSRRRPFMSVNLSAVQLTDESFAGYAAELLRSVGLSPRDLVLETTESTRLDQDSASVALRQIRTTGIRLAIDDFGTGYASLSQLRRIPFDIVKIDQTFVAALGPGSRAESLIAGIVDLARKLNILVIAEGIETSEQLARLRQMGCAQGQGFYFAEPMPAAELRALLGLPQPPRRRASVTRQPTFVTRPLPKAGG